MSLLLLYVHVNKHVLQVDLYIRIHVDYTSLDIIILDVSLDVAGHVY